MRKNQTVNKRVCKKNTEFHPENCSHIDQMTYENLRSNIKQSGMQIGEFAKMLKMSRISISNLSQKKVSIPKTLFVISVLTREMHKAGIDFVSIVNSLPLEFQRRRRR